MQPARLKRGRRGKCSEREELALRPPSRAMGLTLQRNTAIVDLVPPNVRAKPTAEAGAGWPRKDNFYHGLERPDGGWRSGSAP